MPRKMQKIFKLLFTFRFIVILIYIYIFVILAVAGTNISGWSLLPASSINILLIFFYKWIILHGLFFLSWIHFLVWVCQQSKICIIYLFVTLSCLAQQCLTKNLTWRQRRQPLPLADFGSPRRSLAVPRGSFTPGWGSQEGLRSPLPTTACKWFGKNKIFSGNVEKHKTCNKNHNILFLFLFFV